MDRTRIFLNTWKAYNDGSIGYGWMTAEEARKFIDENPERDGGEWFIADIDNSLRVDFGNLDYANVDVVIDTIRTLENMEEQKQEEVVALMEYLSTNDVHEAIDRLDDFYFYPDIDTYHSCCDEALDFSNCGWMEVYFDYEEYHRDCDFDVHEASNGIVILKN